MASPAYRHLAAILGPALVVFAIAGCTDGDETPVLTTVPPTVTPDVGDGTTIDLEPGSNLPPTEQDRSGDDVGPDYTIPHDDSGDFDG
jgi:hypothetical protein